MKSYQPAKYLGKQEQEIYIAVPNISYSELILELQY